MEPDNFENDTTVGRDMTRMKHNELANMKQEIDKKLAPVIAKMTQYSVEYEELISPDRLEGDEYWDCLSYNLSDIEYPSSSILTDMLVVVNELDLNDCEDTLCSVTFDNTSTGLSSHLKWNQDEIRGKEVYSDVKFLMKMLELGIKYCEIHSKLHEQEYLKTKLEVFDCFLNHTFLNNTEGMLKYDKTKLLKSIFSLNDYINTVIFIFGIMVNMFGIVIIMQHKSYKPGFSVLIAILLLTDASFIFWRVGFELLIFLNWEYHYIYMFYIDGIVEYYYIASFITNILQQFEACLIAFLSAKRTLSIFAGKINDSVKNTVIAILFIFLIVVLLNLPALFFPNFSCNSSSKYNYISILYSKCQVWFSLVAGACIPYSVILLCNFSLIVHMLISYVHHSNTTFSETKNTNNVGRAVFLLFCVSTSFSAFTLPFYIHLIQYNSHSYAGLYEKHDNTFFYIQTGSYVVFKALFNLNFCANFFFYCVSSEKFRADIKKLVIPKCFKSLHESET